MEENNNKNELNSEQMEEVNGGIGGRGMHKSDKPCPQCGEMLVYDFIPRTVVKNYVCRKCGWSGNVK